MLNSRLNGSPSLIEAPLVQNCYGFHKSCSRSCNFKHIIARRGRIVGSSNYFNYHGNFNNYNVKQDNKLFGHGRREIVPLAIVREEDGGIGNITDYDEGFLNHISGQLNAFYRFTRPHTIYGTLIGITSVSLLPVTSFSDLSPLFFLGILQVLAPSILMNIYIVGLNQLFDLQIDKVNKPDLPLASGEFTIQTGSTIVSLSCLLSFAMGFASQSPPLLMALLTSFLLGSAYSIDLPMLRWKKQAFLAATCIVVVRAIVVQLAFFVHIQKYVLGKPIMLTGSVIFATVFMCFFATVIALFKDIPDVDGDKYFGIQSFTVTLGKEKVFWVCIKMLLAAYAAAIALGATSPSLTTKLVTVLGHSALALILWLNAQSVDLNDNVSITSFYMFIWKLFYAEYFLVPFIR